MNEQPPRFLDPDDVLLIHLLAILDQGGVPGIRDRGMLESAIAMPRQQSGGAWLHPDVPSMAAAYAFHIIRNHPFIDGNKRAGVGAMIQFLSDNGWSFVATAEESEPVILAVAAGSIDKAQLTEWLGRHIEIV
jgi:death on curing protein